MSDSDDGAFESADEGETVAQDKEESKTSTSQETATEKQTTKTKTEPGGTEQRGKHVKEKPADNKKSLKPHATAVDNRQTTKQTHEQKVEDRDTAKVVTKEGRVKTKKGRRTKAKEGSGIKMKEGSEMKAKEDSDIKAKDGTEIKTKEGNEIKTKEGSDIKAKDGNGIKAKEGREIKAKDGTEIKTKGGSDVKPKEGSGIKAKEGSEIKTKEGSGIKAKEGSDVMAKEGSGIEAKEGSGIEAKEGSEIEAKEGSEIKTKEGSEIKTKEGSEIKTKEGSGIKAKEGSDVTAKEGSGIEAKEGSGIEAKEGSEIKTKEGSEIKTKEGSVIDSKEGSGVVTNEDSEIVTKKGGKAITDQSSNAITNESGVAETTECSGADTTEGIGRENQTQKKTQPGEETKAERKRSESSPKATRRVERRPSPAAEEAPQKKSSGWGWGGWGSSILSTATQSVATLTSTVGEGFSTVMETVEMSLGAVSPEELAEMSGKKKDGATELQEIVGKMKDGPTDETIERTSSGSKQEKDVRATDDSTVVTKQLDHTPIGDEKWDQEAPPIGEQDAGDDAKGKKELQEELEEDEDLSLTALLGELGSAASVAKKWGFTGFSNVHSAVKTTGMTIVTGGLDVLETIGKTTYGVLAEGDTGLKAILMNTSDKPDLSKVLREAKDVAEVKAKENAEFEEARKAHFGAQFDEFQGLVQLEALESLSAECNSGVQTMLNTMPRLGLEDVKPQLVAIKEAFHLKDIDSDDEDEKEQDFGKLVTDHASALGVNVSVEKLLQVEESIKKWLTSYQESPDKRSIRQGKEIHQKAIQSMAEFTATTVAFFHRSGQLLLMDTTVPGTMYKKIAGNLASLTQVSCTEVAILSSMFTQCLNTALASTENAAVVINPLITDVYLEASNSSTYIQDAFQLLLPIIQKAAIQVNMPRLRTLSGSS